MCAMIAMASAALYKSVPLSVTQQMVEKGITVGSFLYDVKSTFT